LRESGVKGKLDLHFTCTGYMNCGAQCLHESLLSKAGAYSTFEIFQDLLRRR